MLVFGLCEGRHEIDGVENYIFSNIVNPFEFDDMAKQIANKIPTGTTNVILYVTGLTTALVAVINFCKVNNIALTLMHFDRNNNNYVSQIIK